MTENEKALLEFALESPDDYSGLIARRDAVLLERCPPDYEQQLERLYAASVEAQRRFREMMAKHPSGGIIASRLRNQK